MNKKAKSILFAGVSLLLISVVAIYFIFATGMSVTINSQTSAVTYYSNSLSKIVVFNVSALGELDITSLNFTVTPITGTTVINITNATTNIAGAAVENDGLSKTANFSKSPYLIRTSQTFTLNITAASDATFSINISSAGIGVLNSTNTTYIVDTLKPNALNISIPINNATNITSRTFAVNATATDTNINYTVTSVTLIGGAGTVVSISNSSTKASAPNNSLTVAADGMYRINVTTYDKAENINSTSTYVIVDTQAPAIVWSYDSSAISAASGTSLSTGNWSLNVSVTDAYSLANESSFNITYTNGTFITHLNSTKIGQYYNATYYNLTNIAEGTINITFIANDTRGWINQTQKFYAYIDRTAPSSITTAAVTTGQTAINFSITIVDATSGVNASCVTDRTGDSVAGTGLVQSVYESSLTCNTAYTYTINCSDKSGNKNSTGTYTVTTDGCDSVASTSSSSTAIYGLYSPTITQLDSGYSKTLAANGGISFKVGTIAHTAKIKTIGTSTVTIEVRSTPQLANLTIGQEKSFDVDADGTLDLSVKLISIDSSKKTANLVFKTITSPAATGTTSTETSTGTTATTAAEKVADVVKNNSTLIIIIVLVIIVAIVSYLLIKRKK